MTLIQAIEENTLAYYRVRASLPVRLLELPRLPRRGGHTGDAVKGERRAFSSIARDFTPFTVYDR